MPTIQNGAAVSDLSWDPFDPQRLAVGTRSDAVGTSTLPWVAVPRVAAQPLSLSACVGAAAGEDAKIRLWRVPEGGLQDTLQEPEAVLRGEHGAGTQLRNWQWGQVGPAVSLSQRWHSALLTRAHGEDLLHPLPPHGSRPPCLLFL